VERVTTDRSKKERRFRKTKTWSSDEIDFRKLNELTIGDLFPLPNIINILDQLGNAKYFSTMDLASGYHQIPMSKEHKNNTAFSTSHGHYEFNCIMNLSFGLRNAFAMFQRLMNTILAGIQGLRYLMHLDIVIYGLSRGT